jgi:hypothetical protein
MQMYNKTLHRCCNHLALNINSESRKLGSYLIEDRVIRLKEYDLRIVEILVAWMKLLC